VKRFLDFLVVDNTSTECKAPGCPTGGGESNQLLQLAIQTTECEQAIQDLDQEFSIFVDQDIRSIANALDLQKDRTPAREEINLCRKWGHVGCSQKSLDDHILRGTEC
jgi:hypothetical protein